VSIFVAQVLRNILSLLRVGGNRSRHIGEWVKPLPEEFDLVEICAPLTVTETINVGENDNISSHMLMSMVLEMEKERKAGS